MSADVIHTESGVSAFTGKPFVVVRWGKERGQLTPAEARELGLSILAAAEAAESDVAVHRVLLTELGVSAQTAAGVIALMRTARSGQ